MRHEQLPFNQRLKISDNQTFEIMNSLYEKKLIKKFVKCFIDDDKDGIDYFIDMDDSRAIPIQCKTRLKGRKDIPVVRFQPFRGIDHESLVIGRDYKALKNKKTQMYFTGIQEEKNSNKFTSVILIEAKKLFDIIIEAEKEWFPKDDHWNYFNNQVYLNTIKKGKNSCRLKVASNGVEAWFKKNPQENFGKINYYVPHIYSDSIMKI
jgi:hypothetical protein